MSAPDIRELAEWAARLVYRHPNPHTRSELIAARLRVLLGRPPWSLCLECGPNIAIDEDGCCAGCGATAVGPHLERVRILEDGVS